MTGSAVNGTVLYAFGNTSGTNQFTVHRYTASSGSSSTQYMTPSDFPGLLPAVYDIAYSSEGIWVARDESDSPILRYNTSGVVTGYVMGTTVPAAAGLTVDPEGYLWVSDPDNDKIYKLDTTTGISESGNMGIDPTTISPVSNPFNSIAAINAAGFADGTSVEVFDLRGRVLHSGYVNSGSFSWDASLDPAGTYMVRVTNQQHSATTRMMKI